MNCRLVSVIIPSYNNIRWVSNAIESVLKQSYPYCEIIVVDDGSTDGTGVLLGDTYRDRIKYIYQENKGLSGARNTGLRQARGDYIQFLDADDLIHPDKIRSQVELMQSMESPAVSYSDYYYCDIDDSNRIFPEYYVSPLLSPVRPLEDIARRWETELRIPVHCFLFEAGIFREQGICFDESLPNHEDWDCWMRVFALNPYISFLDKKMAQYRLRSNGMCKDQRKMRNGYLQAIRKQKKLLAHNKAVKKLLEDKEKEIRYIYHEVGFWGRLFRYVPCRMRNISVRYIPLKVQRFFD